MSRTVRSWDVIMPERSAGMREVKPRALLLIAYEGGDEETLRVPVAVARAMRSKHTELGEKGMARSDLLSCVSDLQRECAKDRMVSLLERRDCSKAEVLQRLSREGFPTFAQEHALEVGVRCGLLNDALFAERFARSKSMSGWGKRRIEYELGRRGVDVHALVGWPDEFFDVDDEYRRACEVAARKHVREPNARMKLARFLVGRGFAHDLAFRAAEEALDAKVAS